MHSRPGRILAIGALVLLFSLLGSLTALARPTGPVVNDEPGGGKWIYPTSLPYTDVMDVTLATTTTWDQTHACAGDEANTVWYRYRATSSVDLTLDTFGSSYDTTLTVFSATGQYVDCNDDADDINTNPVDSNNEYASYLQVHLKAGYTYVFRVGSYDDPPYCETESSCDGVSDGALVLHVTTAN